MKTVNSKLMQRCKKVTGCCKKHPVIYKAIMHHILTNKSLTPKEAIQTCYENNIFMLLSKAQPFPDDWCVETYLQAEFFSPCSRFL